MERYSRQILLPNFGISAQRVLQQAHVLVVGAGGLGCSAMQYLAAMGIGKLTCIDFDTVQIHNLHRQILYTASDIGRPKAIIAANYLRSRFPDTIIEAIDVAFDNDNAYALVTAADIVIDASDQIAVRYIVDEVCEHAGKPWVYGSLQGMQAQLSLFNDTRLAQPITYRHVFTQRPQPQTIVTCASEGVLGVHAGMLGCMQANEAVKWITQTGTTFSTALCIMNFENGLQHILDTSTTIHQPAKK